MTHWSQRGDGRVLVGLSCPPLVQDPRTPLCELEGFRVKKEIIYPITDYLNLFRCPHFPSRSCPSRVSSRRGLTISSARVTHGQCPHPVTPHDWSPTGAEGWSVPVVSLVSLTHEPTKTTHTRVPLESRHYQRNFHASDPDSPLGQGFAPVSLFWREMAPPEARRPDTRPRPPVSVSPDAGPTPDRIARPSVRLV